MIVESQQRQVLQVEVVLSPDEFDKHTKELGEIATTLAGVSSEVVPVVTDPVYKHGLTQSGELEGVAKVFEQQLIRLSPVGLRGAIIAARSEYAEEMGLQEDAWAEEHKVPEALSRWVLTLTTRKSFIDALSSLDTAGVKERIERMRNLTGWMIYIFDATDGIFVTKRSTTSNVDLLLEGQLGDKLDTKINPAHYQSPDVPLFDNPLILKAFLGQEGIVDYADRDESNDAQVLNKAHDMAELYEIFTSTDQPDNASLQDFEQWIHRSGTVQSFHKGYLLSILSDMRYATAAPNEFEREKDVQLIRASLTDALLRGLEPHIVRECARVLNTYVLI